MQKGEVTLSFESPDYLIDSKELGDFIFLFRAIYAASIELLKDIEIDTLLNEKDEIIPKLLREIRNIGISDINRLFSTNLGENALLLRKIEKKNPLEMIISGAIIAIVFSAIISGGKFRILGIISGELNPIGDGITKLRNALFPKYFHPGYVIENMVIIFNKEEFDELMKQDLLSRDRGGFQRFLVNLKLRANRINRKLELTSSDIDKIIKYGSQPAKGGWQSRIRKIFGRHFPFEY